MKPCNSVCLLALAGVLSTLLPSPALAQTPEPQEEQAEAELPRFQSRAERERELLLGAHPEEARLLETIEGEVLGLYLPPLTSSPKGALLLTYTGEHPSDCPPAWENLRKALPYYGWGTMVVALPAVAPAAIPPRPLPPIETLQEPSAEQTEDPAPDQTTISNQLAALPDTPTLPRPQRIASRLEAAIAQLEREGQLNLVVMVDNLSVAAALAHLKPGLRVVETNESAQDNRGQSPLAGPVRAVILANIHPHSPLSNQDLAQSFSVPELPLLDLFLGPETGQEALRHKGQSQQQKMLSYQALTLPYPQALDSNSHQSFWIKRLEGFMSRQAQGREQTFGTERSL